MAMRPLFRLGLSLSLPTGPRVIHQSACQMKAAQNSGQIPSGSDRKHVEGKGYSVFYRTRLSVFVIFLLTPPPRNTNKLKSSLTGLSSSIAKKYMVLINLVF